MHRSLPLFATLVIAGACSTVDLPPSRPLGVGAGPPASGGAGGTDGVGGSAGAAVSAGGTGGTGGSPLLPNGEACDGPTVCASGHCADGVCCDTACEGTCLRCDVAESPGVCTPEPSTTTCTAGLCDGAGTCATGGPVDLTGFAGGAGNDTGTDSAVDSAGDLLLVGTFASPVDFGAGPITIGASPTSALVKLDPQGNLLWSHTLGDTGECNLRAVEVGPDDSVIVSGNLQGTMSVGAEVFDTEGSWAAFALAFDAAGALQWSWLAETSGGLSQQFLAVGPDGSATLTGTVTGLIDFGLGPVDAGTRWTSYVVRLDPTGEAQWADVATLGPGGQIGIVPMGVAVSGDSAFVTGWFEAETVTLGGSATLTLAKQGSLSGQDAFVARYDGQGNVPWAHDYGDFLSDIGEGITVDADGNLWVSGSFNGAIDFGGGELPNPSDTGTTIIALDIFLAKLDAQGNHLFSTAIGPMQSYGFYHARVTTDPAGNVVVSGRMDAPVDIAGLGEVSGDTFLHKRASDGTPLWARGVDGLGVVPWTGKHTSTGPAGQVVFFGHTDASVDVDLSAPFTSSGGDDALLLVLEP